MNATTVPQATSKRLTLKTALQLDAVVTGANGAAYLALASVLDGPLGLDAALLRGVGAFLLLFAAAVALTAARPRRAAVIAVIAANALWAVDSLAVAAFGWGSPSDLGTAWIVLQAAVVACFGGLQLAARR